MSSDGPKPRKSPAMPALPGIGLHLNSLSTITKDVLVSWDAILWYYLYVNSFMFLLQFICIYVWSPQEMFTKKF
jgi:hypothetical protein